MDLSYVRDLENILTNKTFRTTVGVATLRDLEAAHNSGARAELIDKLTAVDLLRLTLNPGTSSVQDIQRALYACSERLTKWHDAVYATLYNGEVTEIRAITVITDSPRGQAITAIMLRTMRVVLEELPRMRESMLQRIIEENIKMLAWASEKGLEIPTRVQDHMAYIKMVRTSSDGR